MEGAGAAGDAVARSNGLAELIARMVQREADGAEVSAVDLRSVDEQLDGLEATAATMRVDVEAMRAWYEGLEARQAQLDVLLRLRLALRAEASEGSG